MSRPLFSKGELVTFVPDGQKYRVEAVSPENDNVPGERFYFIVTFGRWPWQMIKSHTVPESAAASMLRFTK